MAAGIACRAPFWAGVWQAAVSLAVVLMPPVRAVEKSREELNRQAEQLLDRHGSSILRYAYTYLHSREDAEEILQETLIRFLQAAPKFENDQHAKAWLLRVAGNLSKNKLRAEKLRQGDELKEELIAEERPDLAFVWEAVSRLPLRYRQVIHLFYHEGYAGRQIAQILGKNEATVRSDLQRGREKLRSLLKEEYGIEAAV